MWPQSNNNIIRLIVTHMEFLGYKIKLEEEGIYYARHSGRFDLQILTGETTEMGLLFGGKFVTTHQARNDRSGYMEFINDLNINSNVTKFFREPADGDELVYQAWYPGVYDKATFSMFIDFIQEDITVQFSMHKETDKYLEG